MSITVLNDYSIQCDRQRDGCHRSGLVIRAAASKEDAIDRARNLDWNISDSLRMVSCPSCWEKIMKPYEPPGAYT